MYTSLLATKGCAIPVAQTPNTKKEKQEAQLTEPFFKKSEPL